MTSEGVKGLKFLDEVETANRFVPELRRQGVNAIVVLLHKGGMPAGKGYNYECDSPGPGSGLSGPVVDIAQRLDPEIDAVVTGHTHQAYVCDIPDPLGQSRLVTSAASYGRLFTEIELTYDRVAQDVVRAASAASNLVVTRDVGKAPGSDPARRPLPRAGRPGRQPARGLDLLRHRPCRQHSGEPCR